MSKRLIALPVAMIAMAVFVPGIASATNFATNSTIAIAPAGNAFTGKVTSPRSQCVPTRTVTLQRKLQGAASFTNIGTTHTNSAGNWTVNTTPQNAAQYRAQVAAKNIGGGNNCNARTTTVLTARSTNATIAINSLGNAFGGQVTATTACVTGRTVRLQRKSPGQTTFSNVGTADVTGSNGAWSVATNPVANAQYRASVQAKTAGTNACMAGKSAVTTARTSTVTIQQGGSTNFHGNVNSVTACESNRTVTLQRKTIYQDTFHNIGSDATNASGAWLVPTAVQSGASYRASVSAKQSGANSCLDDLSNTIVAS
jgi:hypothetical protein